jgi:hypothetical protein
LFFCLWFDGKEWQLALITHKMKLKFKNPIGILTVNTLLLHYKDKPWNDFQENNHCLL